MELSGWVKLKNRDLGKDLRWLGSLPTPSVKHRHPWQCCGQGGGAEKRTSPSSGVVISAGMLVWCFWNVFQRSLSRGEESGSAGGKLRNLPGGCVTIFKPLSFPRFVWETECNSYDFQATVLCKSTQEKVQLNRWLCRCGICFKCSLLQLSSRALTPKYTYNGSLNCMNAHQM